MDTDTENELVWRLEERLRVTEGACRLLARRILYLLRGEGTTGDRPAPVPVGRPDIICDECLENLGVCIGLRCKHFRDTV